MNPMFSQYKQKKKRAIDPDAPPRPTLLGHDKQMRERNTEFEEFKRQSNSEIERLNKKVRALESTMNQLLSIVRR
jgi:hypothetical protein